MGLEKTLAKNNHIEITLPTHQDAQLDEHISFYLPSDMTFTKAKKMFKRNFLETELLLHQGNVSQTAKSLAIDRKTIQRFLSIDAQNNLDSLLGYSLLDVQRYQLPLQITSLRSYNSLTWKEAQEVFERQFLFFVLKQHKGNITTVAKKIGLRVETLCRKMKHLALKETVF